MANEPIYDPHAEKAFGAFGHSVGKYLPTKLRRVVAISTAIRAIPATTNKKAK